jgi:hypothetical protein
VNFSDFSGTLEHDIPVIIRHIARKIVTLKAGLFMTLLD